MNDTRTPSARRRAPLGLALLACAALALAASCASSKQLVPMPSQEPSSESGAKALPPGGGKTIASAIVVVDADVITIARYARELEELRRRTEVPTEADLAELSAVVMRRAISERLRENKLKHGAGS